MRLQMSPKGKLQTHLCGVLTCTCWTEPEEEFDSKYLVLFEMEENQETTDIHWISVEENQETTDIHDAELGDVPSTSSQGKR